MAKLTKKEQQTLTVEEKEKYLLGEIDKQDLIQEIRIKSFDLFEKRDDPDFIEQSKVFEEEINTHIPDRFKKKGKKL
jgi:hypothetical protein